MLSRFTALLKWSLASVFLLSLSPAGIAEAHWWKNLSDSDTHKGVTVSARALQKHNGVTLLQLSTAGFDYGQIGPGTFEYVYVVAVSKKGKKHRSWKLFRPQTAGFATVRLHGLLPGEEIVAYAYVDNVKKKQDIRAHVKVEVQQMPDLGVSDLTVSADAAVGVPALISANITDHNSTLASNFTCKLLVNGVRVDRATNISLPAGGSTQCMFAHTFATEGQYQVEVRVGMVLPGEFSRANNSASITVSIANPDVIQTHDNVIWSLSANEARYSYTRVSNTYNGAPIPANLMEGITSVHSYHRQNIRSSITIAGELDLGNPEFTATATHGGTVDFNLSGSDLLPATTNSDGSQCRIIANESSGNYVSLCNHPSYSAAQPYPYGKVEIVHVKGRSITFSEVICHDVGFCGSYAGNFVEETSYGNGTTLAPPMSEVALSVVFKANGIVGSFSKSTGLTFAASEDLPYECDYNDPNNCSSVTFSPGSGVWDGMGLGGQLLFQQ